MSAIKTVIATGASSGLGFEAVMQLVTRSTQPAYRVIVGARNVSAARAAFDALPDGKGREPAVTVLPLELADLRNVKTFAREALEVVGKVGESSTPRVDYLLLNAAITNAANDNPNKIPGKWCEAFVVNHLAQHYLVHLLRDTLVESGTRIVFVSSGAVRYVSDPSKLDTDLLATSEEDGWTTYANTKFAALLGAHWWRRNLSSTPAIVVAVSPGLIPGTGITRGNKETMEMNHPDAKTVPEGAENILRAFWRDDFPEDEEQIFLTSWREWWPKEVYGKTLDRSLWDKWCPGKEEIEKEAGI